ncbi:hypothetical protein G9464_20020 [Halostella sp. JP-L12]|uniref:hypothetical protein n=1 Tax=Halostella TaxID=1843185 RepID=UPI0013CEA7AA|nr:MULTISPECIES: hypothetical protein [Halostella]NHN49859.1 hypothetical protein [Halostella sp. JP-L12]
MVNGHADDETGKDVVTDGDDRKGSLIDRRSYLKAAAGVVSAGAASSVLSGTSSARSQYDTVVDVVDAGADPTGSDPIDGVINQHAGDNTVLVFPDGTYRLDGLSLSGLNNFGMIAADGAEPALRPGNVSSRNWISLTGVSNIEIDGIDYDWQGRGGRTYIRANGDVSINGLNVRGRIRRKHGEGMFMRVDVVDGSATAQVTNCHWVGPRRGDGDNAVGFYTGRNHAGTIVLRNMHLENFSNNAVYASDPGRSNGSGGRTIVEDSTFKNNNVAAVRLGGPGSVCRNNLIVNDEKVPGHGTGINARGVRIRNGRNILVENCDFIYGPNASRSQGAIKFHREGGSAMIRDSRIQMDADYPAINARTPAIGGDTSVVVDNVSVTGDADGGRAISIQDRDGSAVRNSCIHQTGQDRHGVVFENSSNCAVESSNINVSGRAVVMRSSDGTTSNITKNDSCPAPTRDGDTGNSSDRSEMPVLDVVSVDGGPKFSYEFTASGDVERVLYGNGPVSESNDEVVANDDGTVTVSGVTGNGYGDAYRLASTDVVQEFTASVNAENYVLRLDGTEVTADELVSATDGSSDGSTDGSGGSTDGSTDGSSDGSTDGSTDDSSQSTEHSLRIVGKGTATNYEFTASDALEGADSSLETWDAIDGTTASGWVTSSGHEDAFAVVGEVTEFTFLEGDADVYVDGQLVDDPVAATGSTDSTDGSGDSTDDTSDSTALPNSLVVDGTQSGTRSTYRFKVTGDIEKDADLGSINDGDVVADGHAEGFVAGGKDGYRFSGQVTELHLDGNAHIEFNSQ